jgi:hypothetical protein
VGSIPAYQSRYRAWWELRVVLVRELSHEQLIGLLRDIEQPLRTYLDPPTTTTLAFDEIPEPPILAMLATVLSKLANGDYEHQAIEEVRRWSTKMLHDVPCNIQPDTPSNKAVRAFMRKRVAEWPDHLPAPNEMEDIQALQREFPGLTRNEVRIVRVDETPNTWRRQGRRQPWGKTRTG